jgi:hypothetical protein
MEDRHFWQEDDLDRLLSVADPTPGRATRVGHRGVTLTPHKTTQAMKPSLMMNAIYQRQECNNQNNLYHL